MVSFCHVPHLVQLQFYNYKYNYSKNLYGATYSVGRQRLIADKKLRLKYNIKHKVYKVK